MADEVMAQQTQAKFNPHPEGQFVAQCIDVISLGKRVEDYPGRPKRVVPKVAVLFRTGSLGEDGQPIDIGAEFTVSMNEKAALRAFLESWRGKSYDDATAQSGVPLHKLVGNFALISVEHKKAGSGRIYGKIKSVTPVPAGLAKTDLSAGYIRADYWEERKKTYAAEAAQFLQENSATSHEDGFSQAPDPNEPPF